MNLTWQDDGYGGDDLYAGTQKVATYHHCEDGTHDVYFYLPNIDPIHCGEDRNAVRKFATDTAAEWFRKAAL